MNIEKLQDIGTSTICPTIALVRDDKILIGLRHYTPDKWQSISVWTVPGGRCDTGEKVEATLRREVTEETGITDLTIEQFLGEVPGAKTGDVVYVYLGSTDQEAALLEPEKFSEWKWQSIEAMPVDFINPPAWALIQKAIQAKLSA